jgi:hypothetical protein
VVDYLIEDEEEFHRQTSQDEHEVPHAVLESLRLLAQWLSQESGGES